ncbi:MAG: diguanylate cyclase [Phycisphaeraceae bacterium]|nr:diguanylate cyclase [Phycisphaeraceae bacterium]
MSTTRSSDKPRTAARSASGLTPAVHVGRTLIVGDDAFVAQVRSWYEQAGLQSDFDVVGGYLLALGEVGSRPPEVVMGSLRGLGELARSTAANLRRLAPNAKLLLMASNAEVELAQQAVAAGFDAYLSLPPTAQALRDAIVSVEKPPDPATSEAFPARGEPLGDVDLVEHLLADKPNLAQLALRLIAQSAQVTDVGWSTKAQDIPAGRLTAAVALESKTFGHIHAPVAQLGPQGKLLLESWAAWLARWLALEEHQHQLWKVAHTDPLTGVWNRRYFDQFLRDLIERAKQQRFRVTLMIFDIDDFKRYNDRYGHAAGDEILRETARLMQAVVREHDVVARIGGDEFAVIFWDAEGPRRPNSQHPTDVRGAAERFQHAVSSHQFPKLAEEAPGSLTISGGLAGFPWDGRDAEELKEQADRMAMASKRQGKNALTFGPGAAGNH